MLKVVADDVETFSRVVESVQAAAEVEKVRRVSIRCQSVFGDAYLSLIRASFRVHWTDLRMTLQGYPESGLRQGVVMSNWEI